MTLTFTKSRHIADGTCWFSGIYKIVRYEKDSQNHGRHTYRAYHIRKGEKMWGYYVDRDTQFYTRLADAKSACRAHALQNSEPCQAAHERRLTC